MTILTLFGRLMLKIWKFTALVFLGRKAKALIPPLARSIRMNSIGPDECKRVL